MILCTCNYKPLSHKSSFWSVLGERRDDHRLVMTYTPYEFIKYVIDVGNWSAHPDGLDLSLALMLSSLKLFGDYKQLTKESTVEKYIYTDKPFTRFYILNYRYRDWGNRTFKISAELVSGEPPVHSINIISSNPDPLGRVRTLIWDICYTSLHNFMSYNYYNICHPKGGMSNDSWTYNVHDWERKKSHSNLIRNNTLSFKRARLVLKQQFGIPWWITIYNTIRAIHRFNAGIVDSDDEVSNNGFHLQ